MPTLAGAPAKGCGHNPGMTMRLGDLAPAALQNHLKRGRLRLHTGPFCTRISTPLPGVAQAIGRLYAGFPASLDTDTSAFTDFDVGVRRPSGLRHWYKPQVVFELGGQQPFNPLPGDQGFPLLEWGMNWCVYSMCHQYLILHAAVLERGGQAIILPAPSGSGKSTLCAALSFAGWRLLSDELTLIDPRDGSIAPNPRPVSLKNQSIDVIQRFAPNVHFGSRVSETSKGTVAHFAPSAEALRRVNERARPAWVVLPKYTAGHPTTLRRADRAHTFMQLVENAFNYPVFGAEGFEVLARTVDQALCGHFEYSDVHEAVDLFGRLADGQPVPWA
jgi:HprK-related kinase A